jgi:hypothetical protein
MAELKKDVGLRSPRSCCAPKTKRSCCRPEAKEKCCGREDTSCGCSAASRPNPSRSSVQTE